VILGRMRHVHLAGIGGAGMCGLAEILLGHGLTVSGCDLQTSERTDRLSQLGAAISLGHDPSHLDGVDALVVSSAVASSAPELVHAVQLGIPVVRRAELLAEVMRLHHGIAVAGTHGKTTTSAMIAFVLTCGRLDPTSIIGGRVGFLESHAQLGRGRYMVCEADEFDRSFLRLRPVWAVITNVEAEHLDCYGDVADLESAFVSFASTVPFYGAVIACADDPGARRVVENLSARVVTYGLTPEAWLRAVDIDSRPGSSGFTVCAGTEILGEVVLPMPGEHNVSNALAAVAIGLELGLEPGQICRALASFTGVARRFEVLGEAEGVTVVDDYAHHPTEVAATIAAGRQAFPERRLLVAFQPHLFSRTRDLADQLGAALAAADGLMVLPVYGAREQPIPGVDASLVADAARAAGLELVWEVAGFDEACAVLRRIAERDDVMLTLGAGDVNRLAQRWLEGA